MIVHGISSTDLRESPAVWHLLARIELLGAHVAAAVARRRDSDDCEDDDFRGLYVSDAYVDALLSGKPAAVEDDDVVSALVDDVEDAAGRLEHEGVDLPLRTLSRAGRLDAVDVSLLVAAVAPEVEPAFQHLYGYLQDDVTRRRAGPDLALELACGPTGPLFGRWRLGHDGALVRRGLVDVEDADLPFSRRSLVVPDRVVGYLLGDETPDPLVAALAYTPPVWPTGADCELARVVSAGAALVYVQDQEGSGLAAAAGAAGPGSPLVVDLSRIECDDDTAIARAIAIEAMLSNRIVVAGPVEALEKRPALVRSLAGAAPQVVLVGARTWDSRWTPDPPIVVRPPAATSAERASLWRSALGDGVDFDPATATAQFRLGPDQIEAAARGAAARSALYDRSVTVDDLHEAARRQTSSELERLARRIEPMSSWEDLVVPEPVERALRDLAARARYRDRVLDEWGLGARCARRRGVVALFAGPSGTGKTMSAEVIARDLGLDVYVVNLACVVDKYVGETEKNLERIFDEAARVSGVLLFDEADALFGKRSGVEDARDRYANIEIAYLLQRMEAFDGVAVLTSNLRANLDEAFARRLDAVVELPMPDDDARLLLWRANLPPQLPCADDVDLSFLTRFQLSGGNIRNACLAAAYRAAAGDRVVTMADLVRGIAQEYSKLGHMCVEAEFGTYYELVSGT
ncbi:MAG TPA: ATP-binding protein [Actinomycetota bacterium]|nr:ATP-binding protein [Actinomycetota bacterium]